MQLMQVVPSGGQICNLCKWLHLVAKFAINASGAMLLPNLVQVTESISGSVVPLAMFLPLVEACPKPPTPSSVPLLSQPSFHPRERLRFSAKTRSATKELWSFLVLEVKVAPLTSWTSNLCSLATTRSLVESFRTRASTSHARGFWG